MHFNNLNSYLITANTSTMAVSQTFVLDQGCYDCVSNKEVVAPNHYKSGQNCNSMSTTVRNCNAYTLTNLGIQDLQTITGVPKYNEPRTH